MRVLNLVTNDRSRFFTQQVEMLSENGVDATTVAVPGHREYEDGETAGRTILDYLRFAAPALKHAFGDYDLVHANYGLSAPPAVLQPRLPSVISLWGTDLMGQYGWVSRACARHADAVVVMSEEMAAELDRECHVIPHGVNLERFQPGPTAAARQTLGWRDDAHHVLYPYPPERGVKNHPRAVRIVDCVRDRLPDPVMLHTVTGVPHERMSVYMNAADALLVTSDREGSPNAVKEAMACNLPVVSTDVGDVAHRLRDVSPSTVSDDDDRLVAGLADTLSRGERSNGREAVREVSVERTSDRLHDVYRSVIAAE